MPERTAWLFTRGEESVHVQVERGRSGPRLVIRGPGSARASYDFTDSTSLHAFQSTHETGMLQAGFRLQAFIERRGGGERRSAKRQGRDRRES